MKLIKFIASTLIAGLLGVAAASAQDKLIIWIAADRKPGVDVTAKKFTDELGIEAVVEGIPGDQMAQKYINAAQTGKGPDVFVWAHDRLGELVAGGMVAEIEPSGELKGKVNDKGWKAFTMGGKMYGYPIGLETVSLVYNKDLVPSAPETFEELFELNKTVRKGDVYTMIYDYNNFYLSFALFGAQGGYVFGEKANGDLDPGDVGLNKPGSIEGAKMIKRLIDEGVMPKGADWNIMDSKMNAGQSGMMINGPWSWANLEKNKINYGVAALPTLGGKPARPFVGVQGFLINRASQNYELAKEFIENYVMTVGAMKAMDETVSIGAPALKAYYDQRASDPRVQATMTNAQNGVLMPNIPKMGAVWGAMPSALQNITNGEQTPEEALGNAVRRINKS